MSRVDIKDVQGLTAAKFRTAAGAQALDANSKDFDFTNMTMYQVSNSGSSNFPELNGLMNVLINIPLHYSQKIMAQLFFTSNAMYYRKTQDASWEKVSMQ